MKISRSTLYSWHSWLGLVTGLFLIAIGFSGAIVVFAHELEWMITPALRNFPPGASVSADRVVETLEKRFPGGTIQSINLQEGPRSAHTASVADAEKKRFKVFIDPHTGEVRGVKERQVGFSNPVEFLVQLHTRLLIEGWGRWLVGFMGVTLFLSCLTGLFVYRNWIKTLFRMRFGKGWRMMTSDAHKLIGLWSLVFNLGIGATGAVLGLEGLYNEMRRDWFGYKRPQPPGLTAEEVKAYGDSARPLPAARLLQIASARYPDMHIQTLQFPSKPAQAALVRGNHRGLPVENGESRVYMDPFSGRIIFAENAQEKSAGTRIYNTIDPLHYGYFGRDYGSLVEYAVKTLWLLLGMTPGLLALSGFFLWYTRGKPKRAGSARSRAPSKDITPAPAANLKIPQEIPNA